jgi:hypothetical protein
VIVAPLLMEGQPRNSCHRFVELASLTAASLLLGLRLEDLCRSDHRGDIVDPREPWA